MASAIIAASVRGTRTAALEARHGRGLRRDAQSHNWPRRSARPRLSSLGYPRREALPWYIL